jgi:hypothetical protein
MASLTPIRAAVSTNGRQRWVKFGDYTQAVTSQSWLWTLHAEEAPISAAAGRPTSAQLM